MSSSPALPPTQQDAVALHQLLLAQHPTAANDLAQKVADAIDKAFRRTEQIFAKFTNG